ncbi:hypothetical protein HK27_07120 [Acetobacter orientalis]|nr:hypothetical protein HK27_07120 [Acetobacter orientalis]
MTIQHKISGAAQAVALRKVCALLFVKSIKKQGPAYKKCLLALVIKKAESPKSLPLLKAL